MNNQNSGYGQASFMASHVLAQIPPTGKLFVVGDTSVANRDILDQIYKPHDEEVRLLTTITLALAECTANAGDVILVMPNHAETVTTLDLNVAGVSIVCLGNRGNEAVFTFSTAAATITVSAAGISWFGGKFVANKLDVASAFTTAAAKGFTVKGGLFVDSTSILNFLSIVTTGATDNDADDLTVVGNTWYGLNTSPLAFVSILAAQLRPTISLNHLDLAATTGGECITLAAKIVKGAKFEDNIHTVVGAAGTLIGIFLTGSGSTSTGIVKGNLVSSLDTTAELIATAGTGLVFFENYYTGVADKSGKLWPVVDLA